VQDFAHVDQAALAIERVDQSTKRHQVACLRFRVLPDISRQEWLDQREIFPALALQGR